MANQTLTVKDASDATKSLAVFDAETGVLAGQNAISRRISLVSTDSAFGAAAAAYAQYDVVDTVQTMTAVASRNGASVGLLRAQLSLFQTVSGVSFRLHFFGDSPSNSTFTDQDRLTIHTADFHKYFGAVALSPIQIGATAWCFDSGEVSKNIVCTADDVYVVLEVTGAGTFTAEELKLTTLWELDR